MVAWLVVPMVDLKVAQKAAWTVAHLVEMMVTRMVVETVDS